MVVGLNDQDDSTDRWYLKGRVILNALCELGEDKTLRREQLCHYVYEECRGREKLGVPGVVVATAVAPSMECGTTELGRVMGAFPAHQGHFRHTDSGRQLTEGEDLLRWEGVVDEKAVS